jgi:predicted ATP-grasp superfamily ATP-dependent carboligase
VIKALNINYGCFHIEAIKTIDGWELIDFNPRIGGALILESTSRISGSNLVDAWLAQLTRTSFSLSTETEKPKYTVFRVFFASPGRWIQSISKRNSDYFLMPGDCPKLRWKLKFER